MGIRGSQLTQLKVIIDLFDYDADRGDNSPCCTSLKVMIKTYQTFSTQHFLWIPHETPAIFLIIKPRHVVIDTIIAGIIFVHFK